MLSTGPYRYKKITLKAFCYHKTYEVTIKIKILQSRVFFQNDSLYPFILKGFFISRFSVKKAQPPYSKGFPSFSMLLEPDLYFSWHIKFINMQKWKYKLIRRTKPRHLLAVVYDPMAVATIIYRTSNE